MKKNVYVYGNWKMNQLQADIDQFTQKLQDLDVSSSVHMGIAPQTLHLSLLSEKIGQTKIKVGAQTLSQHDHGAYTGETSPVALKELGVQFSLIGHSERRALFKETNDEINLKVLKALEHDLEVVLCIGETLAEREKGVMFDVLTEQLTKGLATFPAVKLSKLLIAYEPVWAIGTGEVATPEQAEEAHLFIEELLSRVLGEESRSVPILYGGSVKPSNFNELLQMPHIDGALIGGASLKAESFKELCAIANSTISLT